MNYKPSRSLIFFATSASTLSLVLYVLVAKTKLHPGFFITACGQVLKNVGEHLHFNPDGLFPSIILLAVAVGIVFSLMRLIAYIKSCQRLDQLPTVGTYPKKLRRILERYHLPQELVLVADEQHLSAYTLGLIHAKMVISQSLIDKLSPKQLEAVVLHEFYHLKAHHGLWLLVSRLISSLLFFIPLIDNLAGQFKTECELAADDFVVQKQKSRRHLCSSLLFSLQSTNNLLPNFAASAIEMRVESLTGSQPSFAAISRLRLAVSFLSLGLIAAAFLVKPGQILARFSPKPAMCKVSGDCDSGDCPHSPITPGINLSSRQPASFASVYTH